MNNLRFSVRAVLAAAVVATAASLVTAEDIIGVQTASLDQPRIYMTLRRQPGGKPMTASAEGAQTFAIEAFLDTGASGIVLSATSAEAMKVRHQLTANNTDVQFEDVGVGGAEQFRVSEPLYVAFAPYSSNTDGDNEGAYSAPQGPVRVQLRPSAGLMDMLTGGLDVAGMPAIAGKVMVMDARPVNTFTDKIKTSLLPPNSPDIPRTQFHVPLSQVSFARFTRMVPSAAQAPNVVANPMIGPNPFAQGDATRPVEVSFGGKTAPITMLLDTGAACSMISKKTAQRLGVTYAPNGKDLVGPPEKEQFSLTVGGIGGQKESKGFFLDVLALPTKEGQPLRYLKAPVLVNDITVADAKSGETFTLDGVFGMNFLVASAAVSGGALPDIGNLTAGPYSYIVFDQPRGVLGLTLTGGK